VNGKPVYTLESTYKDNDPETLGAYTSPRALAVGLARRVAVDHQDDDVMSMAEAVGRAVFDLAAAGGFRPERDEIRDGRTVYGFSTLELDGDGEEVRE
jgi:hypothetical protein